MAGDHRIKRDDRALSYSCQNRRYRTNIRKGHPHGSLADTKGSVLSSALMEGDGCSLWLEHVEEIDTGVEVYWLMWYDPEGKPTIPLSGIFDRAELSHMVGQLVQFVP